MNWNKAKWYISNCKRSYTKNTFSGNKRWSVKEQSIERRPKTSWNTFIWLRYILFITKIWNSDLSSLNVIISSHHFRCKNISLEFNFSLMLMACRWIVQIHFTEILRALKLHFLIRIRVLLCHPNSNLSRLYQRRLTYSKCILIIKCCVIHTVDDIFMITIYHHLSYTFVLLGSYKCRNWYNTAIR